MPRQSNGLRLLGVVIILIQLIDFIIHVSTDQAEPIRIASNIVIIVWIIAALAGWLNARFRNISIAAISTYLVLNIIFLTQNGLTNPEQGGALRTTLFLLVSLTVALSALFTFHTSTSVD
ncbi:MAG: hypothetical protein AMJ56_10310 [Anaerolineae bacterium SG8_19]|nr:MAG: hypothetical protein AMJ56_10310 [Anaerolineae bacterium SG8_19]